MAEDLKKFLDGYSGKLVAPAGFDDRLEKVCNKDGDPIDQALFNVGFQAWFAYVLAEASPENAALVKGIKNLQDTELSSAALQVQHHVTPSSIGSLYDHLFNSSSRGYSRKRKLQLAGPMYDPTNLKIVYDSSPEDHSPKRQRRNLPEPTGTLLASHASSSSLNLAPDLSDQTVGTGTQGQLYQEPPLLANPAAFNVLHEATSTRRSELSLDGQQNYATTAPGRNAWSLHQGRLSSQLAGTPGPGVHRWPLALYLPKVFPSYLCRIIVRQDQKADVTIDFPHDPTVAFLEIRIDAAHVMHIAKEIFDAHIDVDVTNKKRCLIIKHGVEVEIGHHVMLRRASHTGILEILGTHIGNTYRNAPQCVLEEWNGEDRSNCLSMRIEQDASQPGTLRMAMDLEGCTLIKNKLWPHFGLCDSSI